MTATTKKRAAGQRAALRRKVAARKGEVVFELPKSAVVTMRAGRTNVSLSAREYNQWLEDQIDIAESLAALADKTPRIPLEDVLNELGIKL